MAFKCERWTLANVLPVAFVVWIIGTIWTLYSWLHLLPLLQLGKTALELDEDVFHRGAVEAGVSQTLTALLLVCFLRAVCTDPGSVPSTLEWAAEQKAPKLKWSFHAPSAAGEETERLLPQPARCQELKQTGERRFCKWCDSYKPDRCHHCRVCKSCILRMDHHCPWIANCVGFRNHKFFFLLVFYALIDLIFIIVTMSESLWKALSEETPPMHRFLLVFCMTLAVIMGFLLTMFFGLHVWLMLVATTTIEFCEKRHRYGSHSGAGAAPSYDRGLYDNIRAVLGPVPFFWLLPMMPPVGDGLSFALQDKAGKGSAECTEADLGQSRGPEDTANQPEKEATARLALTPQTDTPPLDLSPPEVTGAKAAAV